MGRAAVALPATPVGERARALLGLCEKVKANGAETFDFAGFDGVIGVAPEDPAPVEQRRANWQQMADRLAGGEVVAVEERGDYELHAVVEATDGPRWLLMIGVEDHPPHRIEWFGHRQALSDGMVIRDAVPTDGPGLEELERSDPIVVGDRSLHVERSGDFFDCCRLMHQGMYVVVDDRGRIVAGMGGGLHAARIGGTRYRMGYAHHLRINPDYQRRGLWGHLADAWYERYPMGERLDCSYGYVARANEVMQRAWRTMANKWPVGPSRFLLDCAELGRSGTGRVATFDDIPVIVEVLNRCHDDEEVYAPHTVASFAARVEQAPDLYGIGDVLIAEDDTALVGVWPAGRDAETVIKSPRGVQRQRRAIAADHGFLPDAADELAQLLREWCARLAVAGLTHLVVYSSPRSPGWSVFEGLAVEREDFDYWTPQLAVPDDASTKGVYLDPIYF